MAKKEKDRKLRDAAMLDPDEPARLKVAYKKYFRMGQYNATLEGLKTMAEELSQSNDNVPKIDKKLFKEYGYWLMANTIYFNGCRRQAVDLLTNADVRRWERASVADTDHYKDVTLDRIAKFNDVQLLHITIGSDRLAQKGKTSHDIELDFDQTLKCAYAYYILIKNSLRYTDPDDPFFVDAGGNQLHIRNFYGLKLYQEMCYGMKVKRLRFGQQRHQTATNMLCVPMQGTNTGMAHSQKTQIETYDTKGAEAGIRNKYIANQTLLKNPIITHHDSRQVGKILAEESAKEHDKATGNKLKLLFQNFQNKRVDRHPKSRLKSCERFNFFRTVYSLVSCELSALIFCHGFPDLNNKRLKKYFTRLISLHSAEAQVQREDAAAIGAYLKCTAETAVGSLLYTYKSSFQALVNRRMNPANNEPKYGILGFENIVARNNRRESHIARTNATHEKAYQEALENHKKR